jgi:hypothetical protein
VDLAINNDKRRTTMATVTNTNAKTKAGNGLGGRTRIINLANTDMTQAELDAVIVFLSQGGVAGTNDAHTVAGISVLTESGVFTSGTTDAVQVAIQGTGAFTAAADFGGVTNTTSSLIADYTS